MKLLISVLLMLVPAVALQEAPQPEIVSVALGTLIFHGSGRTFFFVPTQPEMNCRSDTPGEFVCDMVIFQPGFVDDEKETDLRTASYLQP